ncbi:hypothetical protein KUF57_09440 [Mycolicibacterium sp. PAM1]|uniref:Uncharacterized protein n=1 Tax=Mycolicibacterium gilvum (strain PYR-GCK) TaxID=350054 RepID=A4T5P8_MYCGI|nr:conserved hypothetical protein [Mycolicibacterium gilvum PYR-GCK]MBV5243755.1 hypothetical protein [Mycolicibacterium sp. PAM1]MCV7054374.1 hypothetical protein [Mycolicibacterium gilvum]
MRLFLPDPDEPGGVSELTDNQRGDQQIVRVAAPDLQKARKVCARIREDARDVAVILDVTVSVAGDFRAAQRVRGPATDTDADTVHYVGTLDGLANLISDIASAGVADGVTLIPASPRQDVETVGRDILGRLTGRDQPRAS